ncbi:MAG TPA: hypothetical protein VF456_09615 [Vicinamibacterales bacterium]
MSARCNRHPLVVACCCRMYGLMIWCYPSSLRREYGREMLLTFKNTAEDVFNAGTVSLVTVFVLRTLADWLHTAMLEREPPVTYSVLGLSSAENGAAGCIDTSSVSVSFMLATLGVLLLIGGWYEWLKLNATIMSHHRVV